jgi:hypothetical protein
MNDQKVPTGVGMSIIIIVAITAGIFVWQSARDNWEESASAVSIPTSQIRKNKLEENYPEANEVRTVDELASLDLPEGTDVVVRGRPGDCVRFKMLAEDYDGPGNGCYLMGEKYSINLGNYGTEKYRGQPEIVVSGKASFCGGKKTPRRICGLNNTVANNNDIVGGDRDSHGCIGSAGYSWCEEKGRCLRVWEEECEICGKEGESIGGKINECCDGLESVPLSSSGFGGLFECRKK